jgi:uncharacterized tellurite resistance protein B-like protein
MAIYLLLAVLCAVPAMFAASFLRVLYRLVRQLLTIRSAKFTISSQVIEPGDVIEVGARVVPWGKRKVTVHARISCTMFDHRGHELYASNRDMKQTSRHQWATPIITPEYALRSGVVGDSLSTLFSESARRMLIVWSLEVQVRSKKGTVLLRRVYPLEVPEGRPMDASHERMSMLAIDTFSSIKDDMILNWLVNLAAHDGFIDPRERSFLYELMEDAYSVTDQKAADERIERELQRKLVIDSSLLQRHVPTESRVDLYRLVFAMAWRDGVVHQREHEFLANTLQVLGLTANEVRHVEWEIVRELARNSIRNAVR